MKCVTCGKECRKGIVNVQNSASLTQSLTQTLWYPDEYSNKMIKKGAVKLCLKAKGYYCDECMKVYAVFEEK